MKIWVQNFTPKTRKSRLFVFTTKHVNPLLFGLTAEVSGVKLSQLNGFLNKVLHSVKNAYVSPKKFTPDLQIFYTFPVFGLNVHVLGVKVPPNAMKRIIFIKLYPTSKRRMLLSENLPQTSRFFTRIYPQYPWHYATLEEISSRSEKQPFRNYRRSFFFNLNKRNSRRRSRHATTFFLALTTNWSPNFGCIFILYFLNLNNQLQNFNFKSLGGFMKFTLPMVIVLPCQWW